MGNKSQVFEYRNGGLLQLMVVIWFVVLLRSYVKNACVSKSDLIGDGRGKADGEPKEDWKAFASVGRCCGGCCRAPVRGIL